MMFQLQQEEQIAERKVAAYVAKIISSSRSGLCKLIEGNIMKLATEDLKIGALVHGDIGQMNLYCNYARAHWTQPDEHPPVGLILCTQKDEALARYALDGLHNKMLVREYLTALPPESELAREVNRVRGVLVRQAESRRLARSK
jgi:hypothetical protein